MQMELVNCLPDGWLVSPHSEGLRLIAPSYKAIKPFLDKWLPEVRASVDRIGRTVELCGLDSDRTVPIKPRTGAVITMQSEFASILNPAIHAAGLPITLGIRRALDTIANDPDGQWFLHRISADLNKMTQIAISESSRSLIVGATPQQALNRDRRDYMDEESLDGLKQLMRQNMSLGSTVESRWLGFSPVTQSNWRRFNYLYTIVDELPSGELIQLGKCLGVEPIAAPVRS